MEINIFYFFISIYIKCPPHLKKVELESAQDYQ